jgi:hypothetical protein
VNIDWVIPCRYVEVHDGLGTLVGAGIDTYWLPELPAPIQVFLAVRLLATAEELESATEHVSATRIRNPSGDLLDEARGEIVIAGEVTRPDWLVGLTIPAVVQFDATEEGAYMIELDVDDASKSIPIHVALGEPAVAEPPAD